MPGSSVKLYEGAALPDPRKWIGPVMTGHLFSAGPAANTKKVKVCAKDRSGKVYEEHISLVS